jgi:hypothetical protein
MRPLRSPCGAVRPLPAKHAEVDYCAAGFDSRLEGGHAHDLLAIHAPQQCGHWILIDDQQRRCGYLTWLGVTQRSVTDQPEVGSLNALLLVGAHMVVLAAPDGAIAGRLLASVCLHVETGFNDLAHRFEIHAHLRFAIAFGIDRLASQPHLDADIDAKFLGERPGSLQKLTVEPVGWCGKNNRPNAGLD